MFARFTKRRSQIFAAIFGLQHKADTTMRSAIESLKKQGIKVQGIKSEQPINFSQEDAMVILGNPSPRSVVKIVDSVDEINQGRKAGFWTIAIVNPTLNDKESMQHLFREKGANYVINTPEELLAVVGAINHRMAQGQSPTHDSHPILKLK